MSRLRELVLVWESLADDFLSLVQDLDESAWSLPTDCPGWSVHDVVAHVAALESELAGEELLGAEIDLHATHIHGLPGAYTERGVVARRDRSASDLIAEFESAVERREAQLAREPLDDPTGIPAITPGNIGWDWQTLLRNRIIDLWVHEQDIRRAVGKPGGLTSPGARVTQAAFIAALPYVVAKRAGCPPQTTTVVDITGPLTELVGVQVDDDRRGGFIDAVDLDPDLRLTMDTETYLILSAGRRQPEKLPVKVDGDAELAHRVLTAMNLTP